MNGRLLQVGLSSVRQLVPSHETPKPSTADRSLHRIRMQPADVCAHLDNKPKRRDASPLRSVLGKRLEQRNFCKRILSFGRLPDALGALIDFQPLTLSTCLDVVFLLCTSKQKETRNYLLDPLANVAVGDVSKMSLGVCQRPCLPSFVMLSRFVFSHLISKDLSFVEIDHVQLVCVFPPLSFVRSSPCVCAFTCA